MRKKNKEDAFEEMIKPDQIEEVEVLEENIKLDENDKPHRKGRNEESENKKWIKTSIIALIVLSIIAIIIVGFGLYNKMNKKVYNNISIGGVSVSNKTESEVKNVISNLSEELTKNEIKIFQGENNIITIDAKDFDFAIDEKATLNNVMSYGRTGNIIIDNLSVVKTYFKKKDIEIIYTYSEPKLIAIIGEITSNIDGKVVDDAYQLDETNYNLIITKGKSGLYVDVDILKEDIIKELKSGDSLKDYQLKTISSSPKSLDVDVVYSEVAREAKDAYIDDSVKPVLYAKHVVGINFDKDEIRNLLDKKENQIEGKIISFKLKTIDPKVKLSDIKKNLYEDKISSYTTSFASSDANRASNLRLGISMLNGTLVMPGETFSFNATMGDCGLSSRGFKSAAVFKGGKVVKEIGGGICQISSTLYNAVLYANLGIVARSSHALPVGYVPVSRDATVYYPYLDFKFKNNRNFPIKIVATYTSDKKMTIALYGTFEETEYKVELTSWITSTISPKTIYENDSTMEQGKQKSTQLGVNGYNSVAYKKVTLNGKTISYVKLSEDSYKAINKIISVGTKPVVTKPVVTDPVVTDPVDEPDEGEPTTETPSGETDTTVTNP